MKKLGYKGKKIFKIIHICFIIIWVGGIISWLPLFAAFKIDNYVSVHETYINLKTIAFFVIQWGGLGSFLTGLVLGIFTDWKLFRFNWVTTKFFTIIAQFFFTWFYIDQKLFDNILILESKATGALTDPIFLSNHHAIKIGIIIQLIVFLILIYISFFKPLSKKEKSNKTKV